MEEEKKGGGEERDGQERKEGREKERWEMKCQTNVGSLRGIYFWFLRGHKSFILLQSCRTMRKFSLFNWGHLVRHNI